MEQTQLTGAVEAEQIAKWKREKSVDKIKTITGEGHIGYFIKPTRKIIGAAMVHAKDSKGKLDNIKFMDTIKRNVWLGGSDEWLKNDDMTAKFDELLNELQKEVDAELGEL